MFCACRFKSPNRTFQKTSFATLLIGVFVVYVLHTCWITYGFIYTKPCEKSKSKRCIGSYLAEKPRLQLSIFTSLHPDTDSEHSLVLRVEDFDMHSKFEREVAVVLPKEIGSNTTLYSVVFVHQAGVPLSQDERRVHGVVQLTTHMLAKSQDFSHTSDHEIVQEHVKLSRADNPVLRWRSRLRLCIMSEDFVFDGGALPGDLHRYLKVYENGKKMTYLPMLFIDELSNRAKDFMDIKPSTTELPLTVSYDTISLWKLRLWVHIQEAVYFLQQFGKLLIDQKGMTGPGLSEKDLEEIKSLFVDNDLTYLLLTTSLALVHFLFDFLDFRKHFQLWKERDIVREKAGETAARSSVCRLLTFLYLLDEQASLLVFVPVATGTAVEMWKVCKAYKIRFLLRCTQSTDSRRRSGDSRKSRELDNTEFLKCTSYLLHLLCFAGAIYSLLYERYKSLYSWLLGSLVLGIYASGFLSTLPQLVINYKLKTVAPLKSKILVYELFRMFISDAFAITVAMPNSHRLSHFSESVAIVVYLCQRWLYPVDKARSDKYGMLYSEKPQDRLHED